MSSIYHDYEIFLIKKNLLRYIEDASRDIYILNKDKDRELLSPELRTLLAFYDEFYRI